jgi:predicted AAA+ superfamily ATPase
MLIKRQAYLDNLLTFKDTQIIKIVTGIRRCGKSTLLELYREYLRETGISTDQLIWLNLEDGEWMDIETYKQLYAAIERRLVSDQRNYIFLDEVQRIPDFQKALDSLFIKKNCDLYVTGSNAFLLSGELATLLAGRYVEIKMLPLSFREYASAFPEHTDYEQLYRDYIYNSGFPYTISISRHQDIRQYLDGIFDSIVLKDIVARKRYTDVSILQRLVRFLFDNIGNLCSVKKIADTLNSSGRKTTIPTVDTYLTALTESFVFYKASRYDVKGKQYLQTGDKYYAADIGLRYNVLGSKPADLGHILENVVYLELLRRGFEIYVGKVGTTEIDFVAVNEQGTSYYQVAYTIVDADGKCLERELAPLRHIKDNYPKYLLTMDVMPPVNYDGIRHLYVLDWLLQDNSF